MDTPAIIVLIVFVFCIGLVIFLKLHVQAERRIGCAWMWIAPLWLIATILGEFAIGWGFNSSCSKYLGCVSGFFGYDAFEHLFFGLALGLFIFWLDRVSPRFSLASKKRWKTILIVVAMVALVAVAWEILECAHDAFRVDALGEHLFNLRLHINYLDQPTNLDTMGDLSFSMAGALLAALVARILEPNSLRAQTRS